MQVFRLVMGPRFLWGAHGRTVRKNLVTTSAQIIQQPGKLPFKPMGEPRGEDRHPEEEHWKIKVFCIFMGGGVDRHTISKPWRGKVVKVTENRTAREAVCARHSSSCTVAQNVNKNKNWEKKDTTLFTILKLSYIFSILSIWKVANCCRHHARKWRRITFRNTDRSGRLSDRYRAFFVCVGGGGRGGDSPLLKQTQFKYRKGELVQKFCEYKTFNVARVCGRWVLSEKRRNVQYKVFRLVVMDGLVHKYNVAIIPNCMIQKIDWFKGVNWSKIVQNGLDQNCIRFWFIFVFRRQKSISLGSSALQQKGQGII